MTGVVRCLERRSAHRLQRIYSIKAVRTWFYPLLQFYTSYG